MSVMTSERFLALIAAWGADARRWPQGERTEAQAFVAANPETAHAALAGAHLVDALLQLSPAPQVSMALRDRVIASAAGSGLKARREGRRWLDRLALALGAGWTVAACAGVAAGVMLTAHMSADARADEVLYQASLMGIDDAEVLG